MIALKKTEHSDFCRDFFSKKAGFGLNVSCNNFYLAKKLIKQGFDVDMNTEAFRLLEDFIKNLKSLKLELLHFSFSYNYDHNKYIYRYKVRSKKHDNADLQIDGIIDEDIPFNFFPSMFAKWISEIILNIPTHLLINVSSGN